MKKGDKVKIDKVPYDDFKYIPSAQDFYDTEKKYKFEVLRNWNDGTIDIWHGDGGATIHTKYLKGVK
jgi:hypothetical protein